MEIKFLQKKRNNYLLLGLLGSTMSASLSAQELRSDLTPSEDISLKYRTSIDESEFILADSPRENEYFILHFNESIPSPHTLESNGVTSLNYMNETSIYAHIPVGNDISDLAGFEWAMELSKRDKIQKNINTLYERMDLLPVFIYLPSNLTPLEIEAFSSEMGIHSLSIPNLPLQVVAAEVTSSKLDEIASDNRTSWISPIPPAALSGDHFHFCLGSGTPYGYQAEFVMPGKYVLQGSDWDGPGLGCADLTYHFENGTPDIAGNDEWQVVRDAMAEWVNYAGLTFTETPIVGLANSMDISWGAGDHGDDFPFDGPSGTLAHAFFPEFGGEMHFDEDEDWTTTGGGIDLYAVAVHEIGHALGLSHSENGSAVMAPYYAGAITGLHPDDIAGIQALYSSTPCGGTEYCASSGTNSTYEWIESTTINGAVNTSGNNSGYGNFTGASPITLTPGADVDVNLVPSFSGTVYSEFWRIWIDYNNNNTFDADELVFNGSGTSAITGSFTVPTGLTGTTRMRVSMKWDAYAEACETFGYGEVEDYTVSFAAPEISYCESKGTNSSYEWISAVSIGGALHDSGNDDGYGDYTGLTYTASPGTFAISLTPGFSASSYNEFWTIWVDLNQNGEFEDSEALFNGSGTGTTTGDMIIPSGFEGVTTRMRVSMKWNATATPCETFGYGEVQDYTIQINPAAIVANLSRDEVKLELYPNPATEILYIKNAINNLTYSIVDLSGRLIQSGQVNNQQVSITNLISGQYLIKLSDGTDVQIHQFIVK